MQRAENYVSHANSLFLQKKIMIHILFASISGGRLKDTQLFKTVHVMGVENQMDIHNDKSESFHNILLFLIHRLCFYRAALG